MTILALEQTMQAPKLRVRRKKSKTLEQETDPSRIFYVPNEIFERRREDVPTDIQSPYSNTAFASAIVEARWIPSQSIDDREDILPRSQLVLLSSRQTETLFLAYNYAKYQAEQSRQVGKEDLSKQHMKHALNIRADLVALNMALVLAMAKRVRVSNVEFSDLVSEGNFALLRSVEKFDVSRGFRFSTYACRSILKSFNRLVAKAGNYQKHFPSEHDFVEEDFYATRAHSKEARYNSDIDAMRDVIQNNRARLTDVERTILHERFYREKKTTLVDVGKMVGLTNERVRQIQNQAIAKVKEAMGYFPASSKPSSIPTFSVEVPNLTSSVEPTPVQSKPTPVQEEYTSIFSKYRKLKEDTKIRSATARYPAIRADTYMGADITPRDFILRANAIGVSIGCIKDELFSYYGLRDSQSNISQKCTTWTENMTAKERTMLSRFSRRALENLE